MMHTGDLFNRNLRALSQRNSGLCDLLIRSEISVSRYTFVESRSGELLPAFLDQGGTAHPLHSTMDPRKEAARLIDTVHSEGFLILLGLGGGYYAEAALTRDDIGMVVVIEYGLCGLAELFNHLDYSRLIEDPRFSLVVDLNGKELERQILNIYQPVLFGGIRVIPLRPRTSFEPEPFAAAGEAIQAAIDRVSPDYSVQAHFGKRWLSNIVRNLKRAGEAHEAVPSIRRAAVSAAGPSLSLQIPILRKKRKDVFLIATDTSLPCLLGGGITPDVVISIDCQHISYYHFMGGFPKGIPLFLDLASPPLLASRSKKPIFFTGGHPLTRYISQVWKPITELDTSGGNVTYAAISLAEKLGASEIELYGADFSYPRGVSYARGTYIYPFFEKRQNRLSPLEAQSSAFLYRTPLEKKSAGDSWYYENQILRFYRERLEERSEAMEATLIPVEGLGAKINIRQTKKPVSLPQRSENFFPAVKAAMDSGEFLRSYKNEIAKLPIPKGNAALYLASLDDSSRSVFTTILPVAAALKKRNARNSNSIEDFREVIENAKTCCIKEIDSVLSQ